MTVNLLIQDLIKEQDLLNIMDPQTKTVFQHFKNNRVFDCHYINDNNSQQRKNDKYTILYQQIINMSLSIKNMFNDEYPHLLSGIDKYIDKYIVNNQSNPSPHFIRQMHRWFHY